MEVRTIKLIDGNTLRMKYTVEERSDGIFLATAWDPYDGAEVDRFVEEYETYDGALCAILELALELCAHCAGLKREDTF